MPEQFNYVHEPLIHQGDAATRRLQQLGIVPGRLYTALDAGDVAARQADEFSPVTAAGTLRWMETVRMLRQGLVTDGWTPNDDRNSPRAIDPSGQFAVVPVSGTADTGLKEGTPKTANPRGKASSRGIVDAWHERILLPARTFGVDQDLPLDAGGTDDVEFDIAAR